MLLSSPPAAAAAAAAAAALGDPAVTPDPLLRGTAVGAVPDGGEGCWAPLPLPGLALPPGDWPLLLPPPPPAAAAVCCCWVSTSCIPFCIMPVMQIEGWLFK